MYDRRLFLKTSMQLGALAALTPSLLNASPLKRQFYKISVSEYSFQKSLKKGLFTHLDFPENTSKLEIDAIDFGSVFFNGKQNDAEYLKTLVKKCADFSIKPQTLIVEQGDLFVSSATERIKNLDSYKKWLDVAQVLGCKAISISDTSKGNLATANKNKVESLTTLCDYAAPLGLNILIRNANANAAAMSDLMLATKKVNMGTMPEFAKTSPKADVKSDPVKNMETVSRFAKIFTAKSYDFDSEGNETTIDYFLMLGMVNTALFKDYISIHYDGKKLSEAEGIKATQALLLKSCEKIVEH